jgi:ribonucleoside-triphosphate reductase
MRKLRKVVKRDGSIVDYDRTKIARAIGKANADVQETQRVTTEEIEAIIDKLEEETNKDRILIEDIQDFVEDSLIHMDKADLAKAYIIYRYTHRLTRQIKNTTDEAVLSLIRGQNKDVAEENSNKNAHIAPTQRDLIAGEISKDLTWRELLPKNIVDAHKDAILHFHDSDYFLQPIFNCCLINIKDIFENGTVMNGKLIESPKSFQVACTVMTQVISSVASAQYGGQSVNIAHLGPYLRIDLEKNRRLLREADDTLTEAQIEKLAKAATKKNLKSGIQTIQYQINTLMTTNGQSPFVTLFMYVRDDDEYKEEVAMIIEEILRQRIEGIKNEKGVYITPAFPKLVYVLDTNNNLTGGEYDWLTELAVRCTAKRMYPDYISAKKMRENYEGNVFSPMGCRSFLSPWKDENGEYKWEGRFNQGVVSINLPQIGIIANGDEDKFWNMLDARLDLCYQALMCRHNALKGTLSDMSPIHWQYGAIARLKKGEPIDKLLMDGYSTLSLGYIGLYECTIAMKGVSHTTPEGSEFALRVMNHLKEATERWKKETGLGFGLYGTPAESLCYRFARIDEEKFGKIPNITDKGYYTNSYHVDVREKIDVFSKFKFESQFQPISSGGAISYAEIPNMSKNLEALADVVKYIYDNIQYAEFNTKSDYCHVCGFDGEILINENMEWECPQCHNKDHSKMNVTRRTCGYLGENFWNVGKTKEISQRKLHL